MHSQISGQRVDASVLLKRGNKILKGGRRLEGHGRKSGWGGRKGGAVSSIRGD